MSKFETFKEIKIGGLDKEELLQRLVEEGIQFNEYAQTLFEHPEFSPSIKVEKVKLVKVTLAELGLGGSCSFNEFVSHASQLGLELCPLYLAAFFRLEYLDQLEGPYLTIASEKPESSENFPNGFYLRNIENVFWLRGYKADGFDNWPAVNEFVFIERD